MTPDPATSLSSPDLLSRKRFQLGMILAMAADALQLFIIPSFAEGALSPADDVLDFLIAIIMVRLLGWHWEFLPAFAAELVPGVDLVPFWTLAVGNVYRKWKHTTINVENNRNEQLALPKPHNS